MHELFQLSDGIPALPPEQHQAHLWKCVPPTFCKDDIGVATFRSLVDLNDFITGERVKVQAANGGGEKELNIKKVEQATK